jgi:lysophospholipase L1-like esterase
MTNIKKHYKNKLEEIAKRDYEKGNVVLLGDCVIENLDIEKYFNSPVIYNNGISGDTTTLLKETLYKRAIKYKPSKVFISIGSNDIGFDDRPVKEIYNNIIAIVKELKKRTKDTEIYLVTVVPVNPANMDYINREYVDTRDNFEINMLNYYLKNYARRNRIKFVDINKHLKNDIDQLNLQYTTDGFHLNETAYEIISNLIRQYV